MDLAADKVGGIALYASDEFFAGKENLLKPGRGIWIADKYTDDGKWMDGWESRRKRGPGHDYCILQLGMSGVVHALDIDTNYFTGNFPPYASVDAVCRDDLIGAGPRALDQAIATLKGTDAGWKEILPKSALQGSSQNVFSVTSRERWTHLRLNIYPDGGVARLKVHGVVVPNWERFQPHDLVDLLAVENGGVALTCNDKHYGQPDNLTHPGRSVNMADGWETKRKRGDLTKPDWAILRLGHAGHIRKIEVDTNWFKGNYPDRCSIEAAYLPGAGTAEITAPSVKWTTVLPESKLQAHTRHYFEKEIAASGPFTHVRLNIFPDGGVSRLRVHGTLAT